jgi:hypothetical protein
MSTAKSSPAAYRARDGIQIAAPRERYELLMRHRTGRDVKACSPSFDALLNLRQQLERFDYAMIRLERQGA